MIVASSFTSDATSDNPIPLFQRAFFVSAALWQKMLETLETLSFK